MPKSHLDASLSDMILKSGFSCTATIEECRNMLLHFGQRDITPAVIARVLGMMAKNPSSMTDPPHTSVAPGSGWRDLNDITEIPGVNTWNVENFVQVVQDLAPHINWRDVVSELDYSQFMIHNKKGLRLLMKGIIQGLQEIFPVDCIYRPWNNTDGQLSFIVQSLRNPDVFCFAEYPCRAVDIEILKTAPDEEKKEIATWKSLDLVEALLRLYEVGHYQQVSELFKFPMQNCPDMLVLALLQITPTWNNLKQELISKLMPLFLGNHPNSAVVLHYAWHCQGYSSTIRTLIMHSMAEWYIRGDHHDQTRLSHILDIAQDLKAISMLLNATPFAFVIDLACLASRREYLELDKWLSDKMREHREPFIQSCVTFLKRRCPQLMGGFPKDDLQSKSQQLPTDTIATMLTCLQACASNVSPELQEVILNMIGNASMLLKQRAGPVGPKPQTAGAGPTVTGTTIPVGLPGASNTGLGLGPNFGQTNLTGAGGLTAAESSQVWHNELDTADPLGIPKSWGVPCQASLGFSGTSLSLGTTSQTPGSPAKVFPTQSNSAFGGIQNITSQLQNLSMPGSTSIMPSTDLQSPAQMAGLGAPRTPGVSSMGSLNQEWINQQGPQPTSHTPAQPTVMIDTLKEIDQSSTFPDINQQFTKEVEDEANSYFQRIYSQPPYPTMSVDEVLDMLKRFKDSQNRREKEVCECMLRNIFEEYQFFPKYPERELRTTAVLFGGIIEKRLATYMTQGIALRYVLEALRKPPDSKMYYFGIAALDRFKTRLKDYPVYCQYLAAFPHFSQFPPDLMEYVEYGLSSKEPPHLSQAAGSNAAEAAAAAATAAEQQQQQHRRQRR